MYVVTDMLFFIFFIFQISQSIFNNPIPDSFYTYEQSTLKLYTMNSLPELCHLKPTDRKL